MGNVIPDRPLRSWKWVEGDDPVVSWKDVPEYFRQFDVDCIVGGQDGFLRLARTSRNTARLTETARRALRSVGPGDGSRLTSATAHQAGALRLAVGRR